VGVCVCVCVCIGYKRKDLVAHSYNKKRKK